MRCSWLDRLNKLPRAAASAVARRTRLRRTTRSSSTTGRRAGFKPQRKNGVLGNRAVTKFRYGCSDERGGLPSVQVSPRTGGVARLGRGEMHKVRPTPGTTAEHYRAVRDVWNGTVCITPCRDSVPPLRLTDAAGAHVAQYPTNFRCAASDAKGRYLTHRIGNMVSSY